MHFEKKYMQITSLNTNKQRKELWETWVSEWPGSSLEQGLNSLHPVTAHVLRLHYQQGHSLKDIASIIGKSMPIVRNHHNRGIFKLNQFFLSIKQENGQ